MSTAVSVNTYTHSVTYVADNMLRSIKDIIRQSGLSPEKLTTQLPALQRGISAWLESRHLQQVILEVFDPSTGAFIGRWDFDVCYGTQGDGRMWADTDDIKYHILKAGRWPGHCDYEIITVTSADRPAMTGWESAELRSTDGFLRQSIGTTIDGNGLSTGAAYWRKA